MGSFNHFSDAYTIIDRGDTLVADPGSGGTFNFKAKDNGHSVIASGTRILPDNTPKNIRFTVYATGSVTLTNVLGTTVATLASGEFAECRPLTSTTWGAVVGTVGAVEINTAADVPIVDTGGMYAATNLETALAEVGVALAATTQANTTYNNTDATGTLTAAAIVGGLITRTGETSAYTDTTADGAAIIALIGSGATNASWPLVIKNTVAFNQTIAAPDGTVVLAGMTVIPPNSIGHFLVAYTAADEITITGLYATPQCVLKNVNFTTITEAASITAAAGTLTGAAKCVYATTGSVGNVALTTRTATEMFADIPNAHIGLSWVVRIISDGANTVTLTPGVGVAAVVGTATVATNTWRDFRFIFTSATALTAQVIGMGTVDSTT